LRQSGDRDTQLFETGESPFESMLGGSAPTFGEKYRIRILDSFAQRRPVMLNFDWIHSKADHPLEFAVVLALDSQIASSLHEYRLGRGGMDANRREALGQLLHYASSRGFDYNPFFYFIESLNNNNREKFPQETAKVATSLLYLNLMDSGRFHQTGEIALIRRRSSSIRRSMANRRSKTVDELGLSDFSRGMRPTT